ncbi:MAG: DUF3726 domain-containing protein [Brevirhabdus sp.]
MTRVLRTLSEIRATATKAARGAGCPWGMAEEAGMATRVLEAHGLPGVAALAGLFATPRACACCAEHGDAVCGLVAMAKFSDNGMTDDIRIGPVVAPLLMVAPLLSVQPGARGWCAGWNGAQVECNAQGVTWSGDVASSRAQHLTVRFAPQVVPAAPSNWRSRPVDVTDWEALETLAARTYVPETEASRRHGAGPDKADTD